MTIHAPVTHDTIKMFESGFIHRLTSNIFQRAVGKKEIPLFFPPPTFKEWLFRKNRKVTLIVHCDDILEEYPKIPNNVRVYSADVVDGQI